MPRLPPEGDSTLGEDSLALDTPGGHAVLEAGDAVNILVIRDNEGLRSHLPKQTPSGQTWVSLGIT